MLNDQTPRSADASTKRRLALVLVDLDVPDGAEAATEGVLRRIEQLVRFGVEPGGVVVGEARGALVAGLSVEGFVELVKAVRCG